MDADIAQREALCDRVKQAPIRRGQRLDVPALSAAPHQELDSPSREVDDIFRRRAGPVRLPDEIDGKR
jgi:hypothetical protein